MAKPESLYPEQPDLRAARDCTQPALPQHNMDQFPGWADWNSVERARDNLLLAHHERKTIAPDNLEQVRISKAVVELAKLHLQTVEAAADSRYQSKRNP